MILLDGGIGRLVPGLGPLGVLPANFATGGTSPSPLANDADLPADANTQWLWVLLAPIVPSGTTDANDLGGYSLTSAGDGTYAQSYRGLTIAPDGTVVVYTAIIQTTVGVVVTGSGPRLGVNPTTGEVYMLTLDAGGIPVSATRQNGSVVPIRPMAGTYLGRAQTMAGEILIVV